MEKTISFIGYREATRVIDILSKLRPGMKVGIEVTPSELEALEALQEVYRRGGELGSKHSSALKKLEDRLPHAGAYIKNLIEKIRIVNAEPVPLLDEQAVEKHSKEFLKLFNRIKAFQTGREDLNQFLKKIDLEKEFASLILTKSILKNAWKKADVAVVEAHHVKNIGELTPEESKKRLKFELL